MYLMSLSHTLDGGNTDIRATLIAASIALLGATVSRLERSTKSKKSKRRPDPIDTLALVLAVTTATLLVALTLIV